MNRIACAMAFAALLAAAPGGCAVGDASLLLANSGAARVGLAGQRLGDARETVLAALAEQSASAPRCTASRLAPLAVRKAVVLERCVHGADALAQSQRSFAGRAVSELLTHFIDGRLVRLDARFASSREGGPDAVRASRARLDERFGLAVRAPRPGTTAPADAPAVEVYRWTAGEDLVVLAPDRLSLLDGRVTARLPGLADEPPGN